MEETGIDLGRLEAYDYTLPRELIAQQPTEQRIDARMMVIDRAQGTIAHHHVRDIPEFLSAGDALVLNNTKVIPARLVGVRTSSGGRWEGLYLRTADDDVWEMLSNTRGHLTPGETLSLRDREGRIVVALTVIAKLPGGHLAVRPVEKQSALEFLEQFGRVPIPPYIRDGQMTDQDKERYQTVYAKQPGSVAAPTAGLHFTPDLLRRIQDRSVNTVPVTLHVGLGTFRPVQVERLDEHVMHSEIGELSAASAEKLTLCRRDGGRIIAVGTTSVRVLETAAKAGDGQLQAWSGSTDIFIRPPYRFQAVDGLLTNFHLPKSTLLMLVSAFVGRSLTLEAYQEAIEQKYRFYSYGDCMLIL
ncbi:MAG: tRNA preQ1(34) S-adenosylmethionine ribosyltransferase-isomerase QueA [Pirellulales bacterium]